MDSDQDETKLKSVYESSEVSAGFGSQSDSMDKPEDQEDANSSNNFIIDWISNQSVNQMSTIPGRCISDFTEMQACAPFQKAVFVRKKYIKNSSRNFSRYSSEELLSLVKSFKCGDRQKQSEITSSVFNEILPSLKHSNDTVKGSIMILCHNEQIHNLIVSTMMNYCFSNFDAQEMHQIYESFKIIKYIWSDLSQVCNEKYPSWAGFIVFLSSNAYLDILINYDKYGLFEIKQDILAILKSLENIKLSHKGRPQNIIGIKKFLQMFVKDMIECISTTDKNTLAQFYGFTSQGNIELAVKEVSDYKYLLHSAFCIFLGKQIVKTHRHFDVQLLHRICSERSKSYKNEILHKGFEMLKMLCLKIVHHLLENVYYHDLEAAETITSEIECQYILVSAFCCLVQSHDSNIAIEEMARDLLFQQSLHAKLKIMDLLPRKYKGVGMSKLIEKSSKQVLEQILLSLGISSLDINILNQDSVWRSITGHFNLQKLRGYYHIPCLETLETGYFNPDLENSKSKQYYNELNILRFLPKHENIIAMIAFQQSLPPVFYLMEALPEGSLLARIQSKKNRRDYLSLAELLNYIIQAIDAVAFLHSHLILHGDLTSSAFYLCDGYKRIKLAKFRNAVFVKAENSDTCYDEVNKSMIVPDIDFLPVLWSAPESLLESRLSPATDVYMCGPLIYEIVTHGCWPYTELYQMTLETILITVIFNDQKLFQPMCMPEKLHHLILQCTESNSNERMKLMTLRKELCDLKVECNISTADLFLHSRFPHEKSKMYPKESQRQKESNGNPERSLPQSIKNLKSYGIDYKPIYHRNLQRSRRKNLRVQVTEQELQHPSHPVLFSLETGLKICESMEEVENFSLEEVNSLSNFEIPGFPKQINIIPDRSGKFFRMDYYSPYKDNLFDLALTFTDFHPCVLKIFCNMAAAFAKLHENSWIHRDICARHVYVKNHPDRDVFIGRVGRMKLLPSWKMNQRQSTAMCIKGEVFLDHKRWLGIEVLQTGQYFQSSDVYMLGVLMWEVMNIISYQQCQPISSATEVAPFVYVSAAKLLDFILTGGQLSRPNVCPKWLYEILKDCWNPAPVHRPTMEDLKIKLRDRLQQIENEDSVQGLCDIRWRNYVCSKWNDRQCSRNVDESTTYDDVGT